MSLEVYPECLDPARPEAVLEGQQWFPPGLGVREEDTLSTQLADNPLLKERRAKGREVEPAGLLSPSPMPLSSGDHSSYSFPPVNVRGQQTEQRARNPYFADNSSAMILS